MGAFLAGFRAANIYSTPEQQYKQVMEIGESCAIQVIRRAGLPNHPQHNETCSKIKILEGESQGDCR